MVVAVEVLGARVGVLIYIYTQTHIYMSRRPTARGSRASRPPGAGFRVYFIYTYIYIMYIHTHIYIYIYIYIYIHTYTRRASV